MSAHQAAATREHPVVQELLPFFINGTLSELERARVVRHLTGCANCRAALNEERRLMEWMRAAPDPAGDAQAAWARLARAVGTESRSRARQRWWRPVWAWSLGLAAAAAVLLLFAPIVVVDQDSHTNAYRTLSSEPARMHAGSSTIRAVFVPRATLGDIEKLLAGTGCQIVSGPSPRGVYTLAVPDTSAAEPDEVLAALRASPLVALAEPVGAPGAER
jgi:anti-sigma factor RsiW